MGKVKKPTEKGAKTKNSENESGRTVVGRPRGDRPSTSTAPPLNLMRKTTTKASTLQIEPTIKRDIQQSRRNADKTRDLDKKSKSIQSKTTTTTTTTLPMVGSRTSSWLKSNLLKKLVEKPSKQRKLTKSFEVIHSSEIEFESVHGIQMARVPIFKKSCLTGVIKLVPKSRKEKRKTTNDIEFVILFGNVTVLMPDKEHHFEEGTFFVVPKGGIYGLENKSRSTECLLHFHTKSPS